jgi:hypothetical protein
MANDSNRCAFCSQRARREYTGNRYAVAGGHDAKRTTVKACSRPDHQLKAKQYLDRQNMDEIRERQL